MEIERILISGAGFLADAYDLFVINVAVDMMSKCEYNQSLTNSLKSNVKTTALIGAIVGQLFFGATADLIGRRKVFITTCSLVIIGAFLSATVSDTNNSFGIYSQLCLWRFILGVGVGGEYPLSAAVTSESCTNDTKLVSLAMVFSMQGFGTLLCAIVLVILSQSLGENYNLMWRLALAIGGLPMVVAFYFRWIMHESKSWEQRHEREVQLEEAVTHANANANLLRPSVLSYVNSGLRHVLLVVHESRWNLLGTAGSWFILDIVFYANGLFSGQITQAMGFGSSIQSESLAQLVLQCLSLPGYVFTICFINQVGMSPLQKLGFIMTAIFFILLALFQPNLSSMPLLYIVVYGMTFFFQNFGGNATTYIIPSVIFPTTHKATCHGISSAAGKLGAIVGAETLLHLSSFYCPDYDCRSPYATAEQISHGLRVTFATCGVLSFVGFLWTRALVNGAQVFIEDSVDSDSTSDAPSSSAACTQGHSGSSNSSGSGGDRVSHDTFYKSMNRHQQHQQQKQTQYLPLNTDADDISASLENNPDNDPSVYDRIKSDKTDDSGRQRIYTSTTTNTNTNSNETLGSGEAQQQQQQIAQRVVRASDLTYADTTNHHSNDDDVVYLVSNTDDLNAPLLLR